MDDGFHSFVCGDCWNLGDCACIEWGKTLYCATSCGAVGDLTALLRRPNAVPTACTLCML
jgi:hypothetical protein